VDISVRNIKGEAWQSRVKDTVSYTYSYQQVPSTAKLIPESNSEYTGYIILIGQLKLRANNNFPSKERGTFKKQDISLSHFMQTKLLRTQCPLAVPKTSQTFTRATTESNLNFS
jgi:hypothetical protein